MRAEKISVPFDFLQHLHYIYRRELHLALCTEGAESGVLSRSSSCADTGHTSSNSGIFRCARSPGSLQSRHAAVPTLLLPNQTP